jgi:hypothetical protein
LAADGQLVLDGNTLLQGNPQITAQKPSPILCTRSSEDFRCVGGGVGAPQAAQPGPSTAAGATPRTPLASSNSTNCAVGGDCNPVSTVPPVLSSFFLTFDSGTPRPDGLRDGPSTPESIPAGRSLPALLEHSVLTRRIQGAYSPVNSREIAPRFRQRLKLVRNGEPKPQRAQLAHPTTLVARRKALLLSILPPVKRRRRLLGPCLPQLSDSQGRSRGLFNNPDWKGAFGVVAAPVIG